jgi:hypothetical protein
MKVIIKPISGTPKANLERARHEMERVLAFRGTVDSLNLMNRFKLRYYPSKPQ